MSDIQLTDLTPEEEFERLLVLEDADMQAASLASFARNAWRLIEPAKLEWNWHMDVLFAYLEHWYKGTLRGGTVKNLLLNVSPGGSKPVWVGERVQTGRGLIPLGSVVVGDFVLTHKGRYREVMEVHEQGVLPLLEVSTHNGRQVRTALDHPFLTPYGWTQAQHLTTSDVLGIVVENETYGSPYISAEEARFLGYMVADGGLTTNQIIFTKKDPLVMEDFKRCCSALGFVTTSHANRRIAAVTVKASHDVWLTRDKGPNPFHEFLKRHGLWRANSYSKKIPDAIFEAPLNIKREFFGAYFACDGTLHRRTDSKKRAFRAACSTVSELLAKDLLVLSGMLGIKFKKRTNVAKLKSVKQGDSYTSYVLVASNENEAAKVALLPVIESIDKNTAKEARKTEFEYPILADPVVSVEECGTGECRCLTVHEDRSFTVEGLAVHNSLSTSVFGPAWWWANNPGARYINITNSEGLAERDSVKMRTIVQSDWYQARWGHKFALTKEQSGKLYFTNDKGGFRQALGMNANISGKRGTHLLIDDPIDAKKAFSESDINNVNLTFDQAIGSRLDDVRKSGICIMMQRVGMNDLTGHVLEKEPENWVHVKIPMRWPGKEGYDPIVDLGAEFEHLRDPRHKEGSNPLYFPLRFPEKEVKVAEKRLGEFGTAGQHQQEPVPMGGGIIKKKWWVRWEDMHRWQERNPKLVKRKPPPMKHVFWSWDTAFTTKDRKANAFSAGTKWGLFYDEADEVDKLMLLDRWFGRVAFNDLKERIVSCSKTDTDAHLIERKASGISVIQELRRNKRIKVRSYDPRYDGDKEARAMLCTSHFESGMIVYPDREWAREVIDWVSAFPTGAPPSADITDTCVIPSTLIYCRDGVKRIDEIRVGDYVLTHKGRFRKVTNVMQRSSEHIHRVKASGLDELFITGNHPMLIANRKKATEFVPVCNVKKRDTYQFERKGKTVTSVRRTKYYDMAVMPKIETQEQREFLYLSDFDYDGVFVVDGDLISKAHHKSKKTCNKIVLNEETGWLFGLFLAEGCCTQGRHTIGKTHITCNKEEVEKAKGIFEKYFHVGCGISKGDGAYKLVVSISHISQLFSTFGRLAKNKIIPMWVFETTPSFRRAFIDGLVCGDGYKPNYPQCAQRTRIELASPHIIYQLRMLLASLDIPALSLKGRPERTVQFPGKKYISQCSQTWKLEWTDHPRYAATGLNIDEGIGYWIKDNDRIYKHTMVMNLSVDEDESYVTTGGAVHNCTQAILYVVRKQWIRHPDDALPDEPEAKDEMDDDYQIKRHGTYG